MNTKRIIIILAALFVLTLIHSFYYTWRIGKETEGEADSRPRKIQQAMPEERKRGLPVSNPEEYGILVTDEYSGPQTQEDWDRIISQKIKEAKAQLSPEELEKMSHKIEEDPQKTADKLKVIEANIQRCQEILSGDPDNKETKEKLERLRILKSILKQLP